MAVLAVGGAMPFLQQPYHTIWETFVKAYTEKQKCREMKVRKAASGLHLAGEGKISRGKRAV